MNLRPATVEDLDTEAVFVYNDCNYHTEVDVLDRDKDEVTVCGYNCYTSSDIVCCVSKTDISKYLFVKEEG